MCFGFAQRRIEKCRGDGFNLSGVFAIVSGKKQQHHTRKDSAHAPQTEVLAAAQAKAEVFGKRRFFRDAAVERSAVQV